MRYRAYSHGTSISETPVRLWIITLHPLRKPSTIASRRIRVATAPVMNAITKVSSLQQSISHSNRADAIIRETTLTIKQLKVVIIRRIKLKPTANYVANYCS